MSELLDEAGGEIVEAAIGLSLGGPHRRVIGHAGPAGCTRLPPSGRLRHQVGPSDKLHTHRKVPLVPLVDIFC
jgi:hypothetical protein